MSVPPDSSPGLGLGEAAQVVALHPLLGDAALLAALRTGDGRAKGVFFERFASHVERVLTRVLGYDSELADILQDVFVEALAGIEDVRDAGSLKAWLSTIAVFTARRRIRSRVRRRWLTFLAPESLPEPVSHPNDGEHAEALRRTYRALDHLPADERIAFALRFIDGMELTEVAATCSVSLATVKRRLQRAERRFVNLARRDSVLAEWVTKGHRWGTR